MTSFIIDVKEDPESKDLFIELPQDMLTAAGWSIGDTIDWKEQEDGSFVLTKKLEAPETEWVLVECASTYRIRYMVEVPKGKAEWALDTVTCNEAKEFSQEHIGEQIMSHRVVTEKEALEISDVDSSYGAKWSDEIKKRNFFTTLADQERKDKK